MQGCSNLPHFCQLFGGQKTNKHPKIKAQKTDKNGRKPLDIGTDSIIKTPYINTTARDLSVKNQIYHISPQQQLKLLKGRNGETGPIAAGFLASAVADISGRLLLFLSAWISAGEGAAALQMPQESKTDGSHCYQKDIR